MPEQLLDQRPDIEKYFKISPDHLSAFSFTNIFAWKDFFQFDLKVIRNCLCVFAKNEIGCFLYLPPLGKNVTPEVIDECFHMMEDMNKGSGITRIENVSAKQLPLFPGKRFAHHKKGYEYCYYRDDIASLRGNPYKSKRSSYNQFVRNDKHDYLPYEKHMIDDCLGLYRHWAEDRIKVHSADIYGHMIRENEKVHALVLRHFQQLGLIGRVVTVNGKIKAYSFGYSVNENMFCILFEIADLRHKGLSVYMFREFCRDDALQAYKFINVMDDFEMENIRQTKMSYHPYVLLSSYVVTKEKD